MLTLVSACLCHPYALVGWRLFCRAAVDGCIRAAEGLQIGRYSLPAPQELNGSGAVSLAVRPEDIVLGPQGTAWGEGKAWEGTIDQAIDLGHYRKVLVAVPGLFSGDTDGTMHKVKVYVPKAVAAKEGESVALFPSRYLVYYGGTTPHEVRMQVGGT